MTLQTFSRMTLSHWRQFKEIDISFSNSVTILTGRNGTGKTTILNILAQHSPYFQVFVGSPAQARDSLGRYTSGVWDWLPDYAGEKSEKIGTIEYSGKEISEIRVSKDVGVGFNPQLVPSVSVSVLYIPSHRRLPAYKRVETIPTNPITRDTALKSYQTEFWNGVRGEATRTTPLTKMKEAIVSMAAFGLGNAILSPNEESYAAFRDFEQRLSQIIPANIGFRRIVVQLPDVVIETDSGRFLIDASSGGLMSLIDLTWQITLFGRESSNFVVVIDEPENHLHPSMQREVLPALVNAFPGVQFVVATHSPFVVSSIKDAKVYAFDIEVEDQESKIAEDLSSTHNSVIATPVDLADRTSASEVLRQVLGVPVTVPIWAERELGNVLEKFRGREFSAEDVRELKEELGRHGLDEFLPDAIARVLVKNA